MWYRGPTFRFSSSLSVISFSLARMWRVFWEPCKIGPFVKIVMLLYLELIVTNMMFQVYTTKAGWSNSGRVREATGRIV